jgi:hypothetical protein
MRFRSGEGVDHTLRLSLHIRGTCERLGFTGRHGLKLECPTVANGRPNYITAWNHRINEQRPVRLSWLLEECGGILEPGDFRNSGSGSGPSRESLGVDLTGLEVHGCGPSRKGPYNWRRMDMGIQTLVELVVQHRSQARTGPTGQFLELTPKEQELVARLLMFRTFNEADKTVEWQAFDIIPPGEELWRPISEELWRNDRVEQLRVVLKRSFISY